MTTASAGWLHRVSPLPKLAWLAASLVVILPTMDPGPLATVAAGWGAACLSTRVGGTALRTVVAMAPVGASILVLQAIGYPGCRALACTPVAALGPVPLYAEGVGHGLVLVVRLVALELASVALLATVHPSDLLAALRQVRLPGTIAVTAMLSLRLVPQLGRELREVVAAQQARGMRAGGLRALAAALVPVTAVAFDRITTQVLSLQVRGLGAARRTSYRRVGIGPMGMVGIVAAVAVAAAATWRTAADWGAPRTPGIDVGPAAAVALVVASAVVFATVLAVGLRRLVAR